MNAFSNYHPILLVVYFVLVCSVTIWTMHPVVIIAAFIGAISYFALLKGVAVTVKELIYYSFLALLIFLSYGAFVHNGYTPLFFLNDQPITLQALLKGTAIAVLVVALAFYVKSYFEIFTTTKILFVVAKLSAKVGLLLSMTFRFVPIFKESFMKRKQALQAIGYFTTTSKVEKGQRLVKVWLQSFILTAELVFFKPQVMQARGYGRGKRTQYAIIRYERKDTSLAVLLLVGLCAFVLFYEAYSFYYYPLLKDYTLTTIEIVAMTVLFLLPTFYELKENAKWRYLQSKI